MFVYLVFLLAIPAAECNEVPNPDKLTNCIECELESDLHDVGLNLLQRRATQESTKKDKHVGSDVSQADRLGSDSEFVSGSGKDARVQETKFSDCMLSADESTRTAFRHFQQFLEWQENRELFMEWKSASRKGTLQADDVTQLRPLAHHSHEFGRGREMTFEFGSDTTIVWHLCMWTPLVILLLVFLFFGCVPVARMVWDTMGLIVKALYNAYVGSDYFDTSGHKIDEQDAKTKGLGLHKLVLTEGVARPPNALWRKTWEELTPGQVWALSTVGIADESIYNISRTIHSGFGLSAKDADIYDTQVPEWDSMTSKQRIALGKIGFSKGTWCSDGVRPLKIWEKRWYDLSAFEKVTAGKLMANHDISEDNYAECWDCREGSLFHSRYQQLASKDLELLRTLGFSKDVWIAYHEPELPLSYTDPVRYLLQRNIKRFWFALTSIILIVWILWVCMETGILASVIGDFGVYIIAGVFVAAVVALVGTFLWRALCRLEESILGEVRVVFQHLKNMWDMVHKFDSHIASAFTQQKLILRQKSQHLKQKASDCVQVGCNPIR